MANNRYGYIAKEAFYVHFCGRAPCGARGLKLLGVAAIIVQERRAPCGARGLKHSFRLLPCGLNSRAPCGARGLKLIKTGIVFKAYGRAPCGARGLKLRREREAQCLLKVALLAERVD